MSLLTTALGLQKALGSDNRRQYLKTFLAASLDILDKAIAPVQSVKGHGGDATGVADARAAVLAAEAALGVGGGTVHVPAGTYRVASNLALLPTTTLLFHGGGTLAPDTGVTVTIAGTVQAGLHRIFSGAGLVAFARAQPVHPEWWGAVADVKTAQGASAMTSGSATITMLGGPALAATDVGKIAVVVGAGTAGAPLVTTVTAVTDATHATLGAAAATTVTAARWAIGSDSTAALNACLTAAGAQYGVSCPVRLSGVYGTSGVLVHTGQVVVGEHMENAGFYRLAAGAGAATVSLAPGSSGDNVRLAGFHVNNLFLGAYGGVEIGIAAAVQALASGGFVHDVKVRNAAGRAFDVRCNVALFENLWSQHDQPPPPGNTTAAGFRFIDSLAYAFVLNAEGYYPGGAFALNAGAGSVFTGLQLEIGGSYPTVDVITVGANQQVITGVYAVGPFTHRDLIRILPGVQDVDVTMIRLTAPYTLSTVLTDVDRGATIASTGADYAYPRYWTANNVGMTSGDGAGSIRVRKLAPPHLVLSDANAFSSGVTRALEIIGEAVNPDGGYVKTGGLRLDLTPLTGRAQIDTAVVLETLDSAVGTKRDSLIVDKAGNVLIGPAAIATNATDGFLGLPSCAGTPTGTPTAGAGRTPAVVDSSTGRLYVNPSGAWIPVNDPTAFTAFAPTWTGFSANPTVTSRYKQVGKTVTWTVTATANGTSNATSLTATLPVTAQGTRQGAAYGIGSDNSAALTTPMRVDLTSTTVATFYTSPAGGAWTGSGGKSVSFTLVYEAA